MQKPSEDRYEWCPWLRIAHGYDGLRELDELGELNPLVRGFFRATRYPVDLVTKRTPWCSAFVCSVFEEAGIIHPHTARARHFIVSPHFVLCRPVLGSVLLFERAVRGRLGDVYGHVGFCDRTPTSTELELQCFGGNQNNGCCTQPKSLEQLIIAIWPKGQPMPREGRLPE